MSSVAVIGAGIAGLTAAKDLLGDGHEVVVLEASEHIGGKLRTGRVGGIDLDVGAEAMLALRPEGLDLVKAVGLGEKIVHPAPTPATLLIDGELRPIPPTMMGVPTDIEAAIASGVLTQPVTSVALPVPDGDVSLGKFVADRLGQEVVDRLVEPLVGGIYAGRAEKMSLLATAPMLARLGPDLLAGARNGRSTAVGAGPMLASVEGGMGYFARTLAEGMDIRTSAPVRSLAAAGHGWDIDYGPSAASSKLSVDAVVVATPAPAASRLLATIAPKSSFALADISYASMALVTFVLDGAELPEGSGFLVPPVEDTTIKAATFFTQKWEWMARAAGDATVLRVSIGRAGDTETLRNDDATLTAKSLADLESAFGSTGRLGRVVASHVERWDAGMPQYDVGHLDTMAKVEADIASIPNLQVCGAAYQGVGIPAVIASAHRAARTLLDIE